jgi:hypothetical protein
MGIMNNPKRERDPAKKTKKEQEQARKEYLVDGIAAILTLGREKTDQRKQGR